MRVCGTFLLLLLVAAMAASVRCCLRGGRDCVRDAECCSGCCDAGRCLESASERCLRGAANPCAATQLQCPAGKRCRPQQVSCVAAPCDPVAACVADDLDDYDYQQ